jgi:O-antigen/teichoic acid export membrane protein
MATTRNNILANLFGRVWIALINLLFIPVYLRFLGIEEFGIIGIFASMQAILMVLDGGMSATLNREMARLSVFPEKVQEM